MKLLCLVLLLALSTPACSRFSKASRTERAYYKQLNAIKAARDKRRRLIEHQRATMPSLRSTPAPVETQEVTSTPDGQ